MKYTYYYDRINRVSVTLDGNELNPVDYTYDADGRVIKTVTPVATVESDYAYDLLDKFRNHKIKCVFDVAGEYSSDFVINYLGTVFSNF